MNLPTIDVPEEGKLYLVKFKILSCKGNKNLGKICFGVYEWGGHWLQAYATGNRWILPHAVLEIYGPLE